MSKGQINYLLALATLLVMWLFFNTVYVNAQRNRGGMPMGGMPMGGMMSGPAGRFQNPMGMQNIPQSSNMTELLRNRARAMQTSVTPRKVPSAPSQVPQTDKAANS